MADLLDNINIDYTNDRISNETMASYNITTHRGRFTLDGHVFDVKPISGEESHRYVFNDLHKTLIFSHEKSEHENIMSFIMAFASPDIVNLEQLIETKKKQNKIIKSNKKNNIFKKENNFKHKFKLFTLRVRRTARTFFYKNYKRYEKDSMGRCYAYWIERLVTHQGKKVRFIDLENKYKLSKLDIINLICYINDLSGFTLLQLDLQTK